MTPSPGDFSSFDELRKRFGGGDDEPDPQETPSEGDAEDDEEIPDIDYDAGVRERIDTRPDGTGAMAHGPACYRDEDSEEMQIMASFRVRTVFPEDVLNEVRSLPSNPPPSDYEGVSWRADLRGERIFTIDGEDAKDFDDAICIKRTEDGGFRMSVHIADVSHYVRPGTALDSEALARATSVYVADQVVPMLPEELSNELCSLVPDRPRLAFSVFMDYDARGHRTGYTMTKSVIQSMRRCTYRQVQALLDGVDDASTQKIADLKPDLEIFSEWTKLQHKLRDRRGSLRMQSGEKKYRFDEAGLVVGVYQSENFFSQT
ncbi:MAG: RNB domain-containing ribonuclease, partial [Planctomycetes bacterium]|nr:RNB domain-containing ribonuclease [Planctomycetota bacterium]